MGRPFLSEMRQLADTYAASMTADIAGLCKAISDSAMHPMIAVGSGGSLSAAHLACHFHQRATGQMAKACTPWEVVSMLSDEKAHRVLANSVVLCLSAGGRNKDINKAFRHLAENEPRRLIAVCARPGSPLSRMAQEYEFVDFHELRLPVRKDGFLATNSLLAFAVLLARAFVAMRPDMKVPSHFKDLLGKHADVTDHLDYLRRRLTDALARENLVVLHGSETQPAACDLESKFTEAALGTVQPCDYRNFAHGRHHWLAKRGDSSAVIALAAEGDADIAEKTVGLIPASIPSTILSFSGDAVRCALASLVTGFFVTALTGEVRGIDPGRPGVPLFGRRLYHLSMGRKGTGLRRGDVPVRRKALVSVIPRRSLAKAHKSFTQRLAKALFSGVVLDYDGTLCGHEDRYGAMDSRLGKELGRLLRARINIGIATGRGQSVRVALQQALPKAAWARVVIGYYNGAECSLLTDDLAPHTDEEVCKELSDVLRDIRKMKWLCDGATVTPRPRQVSIEPKNISLLPSVWQTLEHVIHRLGPSGVTVVRSGHSVDLLAPGVSKRNVIDALHDMAGANGAPLLCIGDQGQWPGNDWCLLSESLSLSVDEVSAAVDTCWNLAPAGWRGPQAALAYLRCIVPQKGQFRFDMERLGERNP